MKLFKQTLPVVVTTALVTTSSLVISPVAFAQERAVYRFGRWVIETVPDLIPGRPPKKVPEQIPGGSPRNPSRVPTENPDDLTIPVPSQCRLGTAAARAEYEGSLPGEVADKCRDAYQELENW